MPRTIRVSGEPTLILQPSEMKLGPLADELLEKASGRTPAPRLASFLEKGLRAAAYSTPVCDDGIRCARDGARRRIRFTSHCNP